jgi:hypothetical protein
MLTIFTGIPSSAIRHQHRAMSTSEPSILTPTTASAVLTGDRYVQFGTAEGRYNSNRDRNTGLIKEQDSQKAQTNYENAYNYYQTLPLTKDKFMAKVRAIFKQDCVLYPEVYTVRELVAKDMTANDFQEEAEKVINARKDRKAQIPTDYLRDIINQWINVTELYKVAVQADKRHSILPPCPGPPVNLPDYTPDLVEKLKRDEEYRDNRKNPQQYA